MDYTQLTSIPLFTGISGEDLAMIMDRIELVDMELMPEETLVHENDVCQCMSILREGTIKRTRTYQQGTFSNQRKESKELKYTVTETIDKGIILEPEVLFGLDLRHKNTWTAETTCHLTLIGKEDIRQTLMYVPIWRINLMNLLCTDLQKMTADKMPQPVPTEYERVLQFILRHGTQYGKTLVMDITSEQMGHCVGMDRRMITKVIGQLEAEDLLKKSKQHIEIPNINKIRTYIKTA